MYKIGVLLNHQKTLANFTEDLIMKKLIVAAFLAVSLFGGKTEKTTLEDFNKVQVIDSEDLSMDILYNRDGKIIIEKCIGKCVDEKGNGKIINCRDKDYDYISYRYVDGVKSGDTIITYFIYNPENNAEDDIIERFDYIVDTEK